jgi:hypothetical protein
MRPLNPARNATPFLVYANLTCGKRVLNILSRVQGCGAILTGSKFYNQYLVKTSLSVESVYCEQVHKLVDWRPVEAPGVRREPQDALHLPCRELARQRIGEFG